MKSFGVLMLVALLSMSQTGQSLLKNMKDISTSYLRGLRSGNANADVDFILKSLKSELPSKVKIKNLHNKYAYDCYLTGLGSGIKRSGNAVMTVTDDKAVFTFGLSTKRITIKCRWKTKILFFKLEGTVKAYTNRVSIRAKITLKFAPGAHPVLNEFKVTELQKIRTDVTGAGALANWIAEKILNKKVNKARDRIKKKVEQFVSKKLQSRLNKLKLPGGAFI